MGINFLRALMQDRVTHQRNSPTVDDVGGDVASWSNVATGLRCAIWPVESVPNEAAVFARRDIVTSHILAFARNIGAKATDRFPHPDEAGLYYVVEGVEKYQNYGVLGHPIYLVAANLRTV